MTIRFVIACVHYIEFYFIFSIKIIVVYFQISSNVGAKMCNVIDNKLRSIEDIQKYFFSGVDVIMTCDFY